MKVSEIAENITLKLGLDNLPVGMMYTENRPSNAIGFKSKGNGCILPLIFQSTKGKTIAIDQDTTGWNCSAFYLGYQDWIFEGIECFLSDGKVNGRSGERFIKTEKQAKAFVERFRPESLNRKVTLFKPLTAYMEDEEPELVIFFVNPDQISALVYLLHFRAPERDDLVVTQFISGCGSIITLPMKLKNEGKKQAV